MSEQGPRGERRVVAAAVNSCYFPLYEVEQGITALSYDPVARGKKIPVGEWLSMMGRTRHLTTQPYREVLDALQREVDRRFERLRPWQKVRFYRHFGSFSPVAYVKRHGALMF